MTGYPAGTIVRLKTVTGLPEDVELGVRLFRDVVSGCCTPVPGFVDGWFLVDRESGETVTLTVWRDRDALEEGVGNLRREAEADPEVADLIARVNRNGVRFATYEVAEEVRPGSAGGPADPTA